MYQSAAHALADLGSLLVVVELLSRLTYYEADLWDYVAGDTEQQEACDSILFALGQPCDGRAVEWLSKFLDHPDEEAVDHAASALYRIGEPAREVAQAARTRALAELGGNDPICVDCALTILGALGGPECARAVATRTFDPNPEVRSRALCALSRLPLNSHTVTAGEIILSALADSDERVRLVAATALLRQKERVDGIVEDVASHLGISEVEARSQVLRPLADAVADNDEHVRVAAMRALAGRGREYAEGPIRAALARTRSHEAAPHSVEDWMIRHLLDRLGVTPAETGD